MIFNRYKNNLRGFKKTLKEMKRLEILLEKVGKDKFLEHFAGDHKRHEKLKIKLNKHIFTNINMIGSDFDVFWYVNKVSKLVEVR